ncbi:hypothetical protein Trydic_g10483 [Trypoxylus dichotomus]
MRLKIANELVSINGAGHSAKSPIVPFTKKRKISNMKDSRLGAILFKYKCPTAATHSGGRRYPCSNPQINQGRPSRAELSPLLSLPNDEIIRKDSFAKNFLTKLSNEKEWKGESSTYFLQTNTIKWYADGSKTDRRTGTAVFGPGTKYSEAMGTYPSIF